MRLRNLRWSVFSFSSDEHIFYHQGFDIGDVHWLFIDALGVIFQGWWFWVDNNSHLTLRIAPAHFSSVHLLEWGFTSVKIHFSFSLEKGLTSPVFVEPLSLHGANRKAKSDEIAWVKDKVQFRMVLPSLLASRTSKLKFLSL